MTQAIKPVTQVRARALMAILMSLLMVISFIPPSALTAYDVLAGTSARAQVSTAAAGSFIGAAEAAAGTSAIATQTAESYTPSSARIIGSETWRAPGGAQYSLVSTVGSSLSASDMQVNADGSITGYLDTAAGYTIASVSISTGDAAAPVGSSDDYVLASISEDGGSFTFQPPSSSVSDRYVVTPFAASTTVWDGSVDVSWYDPAASTYYIGEPAELAGLAALTNGMVDVDTPSTMIIGDASLIKSTAHEDVMLVGAGGGNVSDTVYTSDIDFSYKTIYLTADLDMGGYQVGDTWTGPNYTPVGGKYSMDPDMVEGDSYVLDTRFNGVFDGQGHTVKNIYCWRYAEKGFPYSMAVGLVGYLGGVSDTTQVNGDIMTFENGWVPAVRNVIVGDGYIYGRRMVGGVVGRVGETSEGVIIENCANHASIYNTDAKGVGGILGSSSGEGTIRNCYNTGNVTTTFSCPAGGIIGANAGMDIYNCYNVGTINSNGANRGRGIGGHDTGSYTVDNCYTLKGCDDDADSSGYYVGASKKITVNVVQMTSEQMKGKSLADKLNANGPVFTVVDGMNDGYPVLYYEADGYNVSGSYTVAVKQPSNGTISIDVDGAAAPGQIVNFTAEAEPGYKLDYFTINGNKINGEFYSITENVEVSGVFKAIRTVSLKLPSSDEYSLVVTATGYIMDGSEMISVKNTPVYDGAKLMEDTVLLVRASMYADASPADSDLEYTGIVEYDATNATKNSVGKYTVTGDGDVAVTITPQTQMSTWSSHADTTWFSAKKTTYTISTPEELAGLAVLVKDQGLTFEGKTIKLGKDISLAGGTGKRVWQPIGTSATHAFKGTFDGQGHVIGAMLASGDSSYSGLFGFCVGATIKDVTVRGISHSTAGMSYSAGIAAYAEDCSLIGCLNRCDVTATGEYAGGIAAYTTGGTTIESCENYGHISGSTGVGGIAGICQSATDIIKNCINHGDVKATGAGLAGTGGIAGKHIGTITGSINAGTVSGNDRYTGGIVGYTNGRKTSTVKASQNQGTVTSDSENASAGLGGVIGYAQFGTFEDCTSIGKVEAGKAYKSQGIGALIGHIGNEPALTVATDCRYSSKSYSAAVNGADYDGVTLDESVEARACDVSTDPGDPADTSVTGGGSATRVSEICGGTSVGSGTYYLVNYAAGALTVEPGAVVKLIGTSRTLGALTIKVGEGATLTLCDVEYTGDEILLDFTGNATLVLEGKNVLEGTSDAGNNVTPTIYAQGNLTINGSGSLYVGAKRANAAIKVESGKVFTLASGLLSINKEELLGARGGALYANGATVNITGGSLEGITSSDNVSIISASLVNISGGSVSLNATRSPKTIDADVVNVTGGVVRSKGYSGLSVDEADRRAYYGAESIPNLKGSVKYYTETGSYSLALATSQKIIVDGEEVETEVYSIDGYNYFKLRDFAALMAGTGSEFSVGYDSELRSMYTVPGDTYQAVGGEMLTGQDKSSTCLASSWVLYVGDKLVNCSVYNIGGNNFFKLRDLGEAFGVGVDYDKSANAAVITSAR